MKRPLSSKTLNKIALSTSYQEVVELLSEEGWERQEAIEFVDTAFKIHKLNLTCYRGSYV